MNRQRRATCFKTQNQHIHHSSINSNINLDLEFSEIKDKTTVPPLQQDLQRACCGCCCGQPAEDRCWSRCGGSLPDQTNAAAGRRLLQQEAANSCRQLPAAAGGLPPTAEGHLLPAGTMGYAGVSLTTGLAANLRRRRRLLRGKFELAAVAAIGSQ